MAKLLTKTGAHNITRSRINGLGFDQLYTGTVNIQLQNKDIISCGDKLSLQLDCKQNLTIYCHKVKTRLYDKYKIVHLFFSGLNSSCKYKVQRRSFKLQPAAELIHALLRPTNWQIVILCQLAYQHEWQQVNETLWQTFLRLCQQLNLHFVLKTDSVGSTSIIISQTLDDLTPTTYKKINKQDIEYYQETNCATADRIAIDLHNHLHGGLDNYQAHINITNSDEKIIFHNLSATTIDNANRHLLEATSSIEAARKKLIITSNTNLQINNCIEYLGQQWRVISKRITSYRLNSDTLLANYKYSYALQPITYSGINRNCPQPEKINLRLATIKSIYSYSENIYEIYYDDSDNPQLARSVNLWTEASDSENYGGSVLLPPETQVVIAYLHNDQQQAIILGCYGKPNSKHNIIIKLARSMQYSATKTQNLICDNSHLLQSADSLQHKSNAINYNSKSDTTFTENKHSMHYKYLKTTSAEINFYADEKIQINANKFNYKCDQLNVFCRQFNSKNATAKLDCQQLSWQTNNLNLNARQLAITAQQITVNCVQQFILSAASANITINQQGIDCANIILNAGELNA